MEAARETRMSSHESPTPLKPSERYLADHCKHGMKLLQFDELCVCLEAALADLGVDSATRRRSMALRAAEEYALRSDSAAVGAGALDRILQSLTVRVAQEQRELKRKANEAETFDAVAKELRLQAEAQAWAAPSSTSELPIASEEDIPIVDLDRSPREVADKLREACREVGFHYIINHGVSEALLHQAAQAVEAFASLPLTAKEKYKMDAGTYPGGTGYLPVHNFKLPKRRKGNVVEAFIIKREHGPRNITLSDMPWPSELGVEWRQEVELYASRMEDLTRKMLPLYSLALGESPDYLNAAFDSPLWRLRMSKYPAVTEYERDQYGIAPHVDTSFITILHRVESRPGLVVWSAKTKRWVRVPTKPNALLINTGEILKQVSNDTFEAAKHYVLNESPHDRIALAFFINATADFKLCVAPGAGGGPPKYPPTSYLDGQGVIQGE